jgi:hypothetical protein
VNQSNYGNRQCVAGNRLERIQSVSPVLVLTAEGPLVAPIGSLDDPLERKRRAVWHNQASNQVVAEIAGAFADRDIRTLWNHGLLLDQDELPYPAPWPRSTTILVEVAEHGRVLVDRLPGWDLLHAVHGKPGSVYEESSGGGSGLDRRIVTLVAANELKAFAPDVLIVSMGGDWAFELSNFRPTSDQPTLLIDVLDDFDDLAKRGSVARLRTYVARGWKIVAGSKWKALLPGRPRNPHGLGCDRT